MSESESAVPPPPRHHRHDPPSLHVSLCFECNLIIRQRQCQKRRLKHRPALNAVRAIPLRGPTVQNTILRQARYVEALPTRDDGDSKIEGPSLGLAFPMNLDQPGKTLASHQIDPNPTATCGPNGQPLVRQSKERCAFNGSQTWLTRPLLGSDRFAWSSIAASELPLLLKAPIKAIWVSASPTSIGAATQTPNPAEPSGPVSELK